MKKVLSLVLAVVLVFGMATVAFAAAPKITGVEDPFNYYQGLGSSTAWGDSINEGEFAPSEEKVTKLYLRGDNFVWDSGTPGAAVSSSQLSNGKITVKKKVTKGSNVIDKIELKKDGAQMYVKVEYVTEYVSTSEQDFDFTVYLAKSGTKQGNTEIQLYGTLKNEEILLDDGDEEVDLSDGQYAKADGYIKNVRVDTGNGLYINAKMFDGKKYYAKSNQDISASDDAVLNAYPEIETIYYLNSINMSSSGNTVEFDIDDKYYVYNADGQYIGTTADKLPFSSKYYMANTKIDMGSDSASSEEPVENGATEEPIANPGMGGDDVPANTYDNPGTGR